MDLMRPQPACEPSVPIRAPRPLTSSLIWLARGCFRPATPSRARASGVDPGYSSKSGRLSGVGTRKCLPRKGNW